MFVFIHMEKAKTHGSGKMNPYNQRVNKPTLATQS